MWSHSFTNTVAGSGLQELGHTVDNRSAASVNKVMGIPSLKFTAPPPSLTQGQTDPSALPVPIHGSRFEINKLNKKKRKTYLIESRNMP